MERDALALVAARIRQAGRLTILTGAGVSAASGVPTFRGADGLWRQFRPEELATPEAFTRDPALVWEWYAWRREQVAACRPNAAHEVIARWSQEGQTPPHAPTQGVRPPYTGRLKVAVVTQNVDDLHVRAATQGLVRLHGSIWELSCARRCPAGSAAWPDTRVPLPEMPPRCRHCGGLARPAVVWFGEALPRAALTAAARAAACDVFLTVGTSALVYPAAGLLHDARGQGAFTAEINQESTPVSGVVDVAIHGRAEDVLPALDEQLRHAG